MNRHSNKIAALLMYLMLCNQAIATSSQSGRVYEIAEPDALEEIEQRLENKNIAKHYEQQKPDWSALNTIHLPRATENSARYHTPFYITEFDIPDGKGGILYPKGFKLNPLDYAVLPQKIVIADEKDATWILDNIDQNDMVLISHGNREKLSQKIKLPVFILDSKTQERLDIQKVPSIVVQTGNRLKIREFYVEASDEK